MNENLIDRLGFAQKLGVSLRMLAKLRHDNKLPPAFRVGKRALRWRESDVLAFLNANREQPKST